MNSLLKLATDLERKSKEQSDDTERMLKLAFSEHEKSVNEALKSSAKRISNVISDHSLSLNNALEKHSQSMTDVMRSNRNSVLRMTGRTWLTISLTTVLLISTCAGVLWYLGEKITSNLEELSRQQEALSKLNAKTWGVSYHKEKDGQFLVMPKGMKAQPGWTIGEGKSKRNAVKLVKE